MKQLERQDAKTKITKFLAGEKILLSSEEEKILARWEFANEQLIKKDKSWADIRELIVLRFIVSKFTAENDIVNSQEVFGSTRKINKRYLLHLHLDRMDRDIERVRAGLFFGKDEDGKVYNLTPDAKEIAALAKLHESYTYALNSIPEDIDRSKLPPPIFVFKLPEGVTITRPMSIEDALKAADEFLTYEDVTGTTDIQPDGSASEGEGDADPSHDDQADPGE